MSSHKILSFIISVITLRIIIQIIIAFDSHILFDILGDFYTILFFVLEITLTLFLYFFIVNEYGAKISFVPVLIISLFTLYQLFDVIFIFGTNPSIEHSNDDVLVKQLLIRGLPSFIGLSCLIIFAFQLIKNAIANIRVCSSIKLIGKAYLVQILVTFAISPISLITDEFSWIDKVIALSYVLPFVLMLKMYKEEWQLKEVDKRI